MKMFDLRGLNFNYTNSLVNPACSALGTLIPSALTSHIAGRIANKPWTFTVCSTAQWAFLKFVVPNVITPIFRNPTNNWQSQLAGISLSIGGTIAFSAGVTSLAKKHLIPENEAPTNNTKLSATLFLLSGFFRYLELKYDVA